MFALALVMVGIGAMNFLPHGGSAPVPPKPKPIAQNSPQITQTLTVKNPQYANLLPARDPFSSPLKNVSALSAGQNPRMITPQSLGSTSGGTTLPGPNGTAMSGNIAIAPITPQAPPFSYQLSGVIQGHKPAAVFTDTEGNQRLVPIGGSLDGDTTLEHVGANAVTVRYHGDAIHLTLGQSHDGK